MGEAKTPRSFEAKPRKTRGHPRSCEALAEQERGLPSILNFATSIGVRVFAALTAPNLAVSPSFRFDHGRVTVFAWAGHQQTRLTASLGYKASITDSTRPLLSSFMTRTPIDEHYIAAL